MATPSVAWEKIQHRARFHKGCWSREKVRRIWRRAGSPERITAAKVALVGLNVIVPWDQRVPKRYILRWCVGLMSVEQAKSLFKRLKLPSSSMWDQNAPQIWRGKNVHSRLVNYVCSWQVTLRTRERRFKRVLMLISEFK